MENIVVKRGRGRPKKQEIKLNEDVNNINTEVDVKKLELLNRMISVINLNNTFMRSLHRELQV